MARTVEATPLRAGMVADPAGFRWSSDLAGQGLDPDEDWGCLPG